MSRTFGPLRQNGYVVNDLDAAINHWVSVIGVGPFFQVDRLPLTDFRYLGKPSNPDITVALAQSGDIQIELIQPNDHEPSAFRSFLASGREGLQHVAFWTTDFTTDLERHHRAGFQDLQSGRSGSGGPNERFVYFTAEQHPGTVIELSEITGPKGELFRAIAQAAHDWDGSDPVRPATSAGRAFDAR